MKRILPVLFALIFSFSVKAQTPLTEAVNFNSVALNGEHIDLFEILDGGQYVLIEFFYSTSSGALTYVNKMIQSYQYFGCNEHDVFYMQISRYDDKAEARAWCNEYGIMFPTIHTESEGDSGDEICQMYEIPIYPTVVLIAPNREIVLQQIYPVMYVENIIDALTPFGIEEHECSTVLPEVSTEIVNITSSTATVEFTPNFVCEAYHFILGEGNTLEQQELPLEQIIAEQGMEQSDYYVHTWSGLEPETEYSIYVLPENFEGTYSEIEKINFGTTAVAGPSVIELEVEVVSETSVYTKATPNEHTGEYHYGIFYDYEYEELGDEGVIEMLLDDEFPLYAVDEWVWEELEAQTDCYAIAIGYNNDGVLGDMTIVPFRTEVESCLEIEDVKFAITPNPAKSTVNVRLNGNAQVRIFDMTGRCVKDVNATDNATINVEDLNKGVYFVNVNGKVEKLVIE